MSITTSRRIICVYFITEDILNDSYPASPMYEFIIDPKLQWRVRAELIGSDSFLMDRAQRTEIPNWTDWQPRIKIYTFKTPTKHTSNKPFLSFRFLCVCVLIHRCQESSSKMTGNLWEERGGDVCITCCGIRFEQRVCDVTSEVCLTVLNNVITV